MPGLRKVVQPELRNQKIKTWNVVFAGPVWSKAESARDADELSHPFQRASTYACELVLEGNHPGILDKIMVSATVS